MQSQCSLALYLGDTQSCFMCHHIPIHMILNNDMIWHIPIMSFDIGLVKFPVGTVKRWEKITEMICSKTNRTTKEVIQKAKHVVCRD